MSSPLPPDITELLADLLVPLPDPAHDLLREKVLATAQVVWNYHVELVDQLQTAQDDLAALATRVTTLENPTPVPAPTT